MDQVCNRAHRRAAISILGALLPALGCVPGAPAGHADLRGRVLLRSTGQPLPDGVPMAVCARPAGNPAPADVPDPIIWRAGEALSPPFLVVASGQVVRFRNDDDIYHRFFSTSGPNSFDLQLLFPGTASETRFEHAGLVHVYCSLHAGKQGTLLVSPTGHFDTVTAGRFSLTGLLPGRYVLETWGAEQKEHSLEVSVPWPGRDPVEIVLDDQRAGDSH